MDEERKRRARRIMGRQSVNTEATGLFLNER
jgi:hypothetical protein